MFAYSFFNLIVSHAAAGVEEEEEKRKLCAAINKHNALPTRLGLVLVRTFTVLGKHTALLLTLLRVVSIFRFFRETDIKNS
jgi:hypothetical protein